MVYVGVLMETFIYRSEGLYRDYVTFISHLLKVRGFIELEKK